MNNTHTLNAKLSIVSAALQPSGQPRIAAPFAAAAFGPAYVVASLGGFADTTVVQRDDANDIPNRPPAI